MLHTYRVSRDEWDRIMAASAEWHTAQQRYWRILLEIVPHQYFNANGEVKLECEPEVTVIAGRRD